MEKLTRIPWSGEGQIHLGTRQGPHQIGIPIPTLYSVSFGELTRATSISTQPLVSI